MLWHATGAHAATSQTYTVASSSPAVLVSGLRAGDKVDIVATLNTTDVNENGEGEPLKLQSSGGFAATISAYAQPTALSFVATVDGESLSGFIVGFDFDESATVTVTVNSTAKKRLTQAQKDALARASADLNIIAAGGATVMAVCAVLPPPADVCVAFFGPFSGTVWLGSALIGRLALDPADPNFREIFQPVVPEVPPVADVAGITQAERDAYAALMDNLVHAIALADAAQISINRAQAAEDAGDAEWETRQEAAVNDYLAGLGALLRAEPALLTAFAGALEAGGVTRSITSSDAIVFELNVLFYGLPSFLTNTLHALGADDAAIEQIRQLAIVQDIDAMAGSYPQMLTNADLLGSLARAGQALAGDTTAPETTASLAGTQGLSGWYTTPVAVTLSATDPDDAAADIVTTYSVDGGPATAYTAPFTVSGDGTHTVTFFSVDKAGNEETPHGSVTVKIDATAPVAAAAADPSSLWPPNGKSVPVTVSGSLTDATSGLDPATASYTVADEYGAIQPSGTVIVAADGTFSFQVPLEARRRGDDLDGRTYTITVRAADVAGNATSTQVVVTVPHDQR
jgi:hypothetical protein